MRRVRSTGALILAGLAAACGESGPAAPPVEPGPPDPADAPTSEPPPLACYKPVDAIEAEAARLAAVHSDVVRLDPSIGQSWLSTALPGRGHDIFALQVSRGASTHPKAPVLLVGGLHARELSPPDFLLGFVKHLAEKDSVDADVTWLLDHTDLRVIPLANPDGRSFVWGGEALPNANPLWRKNVNAVNGPCPDPDPAYADDGVGVDLNRNFGVDWVVGGNECRSTFPGPFAGSEPETNVIVRYADELFRGRDPAEGFYVDLHAPAPKRIEAGAHLVLWPWAAHETMEHPELEFMGRKVARRGSARGSTAFAALRAIGEEDRGRPLTDAEAAEYAAGGTSADFMYATHDRLPSLAFEMGRIARDPCPTFKSEVEDQYTAALIYVLKAARDAYRLPQGPELRLLEAKVIRNLGSVQGAPRDTTVANLATLTAFANSAHFSGNFDDVARVAYSIDTFPPVHGLGPGTEMISLDGQIDGPSEEMHAIIDISALPAGRHLVYLHGEDHEGDWGLVSAAWLDTPGFGIDGLAFEFTGTVTSLDVPAGYPEGEVLPEYAFAEGDRFRGFFAFEPDTTRFDDGIPTLSRYLNVITSASVTFEGGWAGTGARLGSSPQLERIEVVNKIPGELGPEHDAYWVSTTVLTGPNLMRVDRAIPPRFRRVDRAGTPFSMGLYLEDSSGLALASDALPLRPPSLGAFETRKFYLGFGPDEASSEPFWIHGRIESLTLANFPARSTAGSGAGLR